MTIVNPSQSRSPLASSPMLLADPVRPAGPGRSQTSTSSAAASVNLEGQGEDGEEDVAWNLMEALYSRTAGSGSASGEGDGFDDSMSIGSALSADLNGLTFGAGDESRSTAYAYTHDEGGDGDGDGEIEIPHFPPLSQAYLGGGSGDGDRPARTSERIVGRGRSEQEREKDLLAPVTRENFEKLLESPMGMMRFREWIEQEGYRDSKALLQYYEDARAYGSYLSELAAAATALQAVYFGPATKNSALSRVLNTRPIDCLPALGSTTLGMYTAQSEALDRLYATEFKRFIADKITEQAKAHLGQFSSHDERGSDLGEVFCIANPNLPDQPLVMVSDGFCRLSEYPRDRLVGRNCRFLQGPATDEEAVRLLREAIAAGKEHCSLLLNYTRTGKPFWNLFNLIPLRNASGHIDFFLGAQVDVSRAMTSRKTFDALTGLSKRDERRQGVNEKPTFCDVVLHKMDLKLGRPSMLRQDTSSSVSIGGTRATSYVGSSTLIVPDSPTGSMGSPRTGATSRTSKMRRLLSKSFANEDQSVPMQPIASNGLGTIPIKQEVPDAVREHMSAFSSAYSKCMVVDGSDRSVSFVTPALLVELGYPVRTAKDRLASSLILKDLLDLVVGETAGETEVIRRTLESVMAKEEGHSLFAGLVSFQANRAPRKYGNGNGNGNDGGVNDHNTGGNGFAPTTSGSGSSSGREKTFVRSLLHLTPVRGDKNAPVMYVVVVG